MAHETPPQDSSLTDLPDPEDEPANTEDAAGMEGAAAAPVLNRAERRAQAKGKSSPSGTGGAAGGPGSVPRAPGARAGGHVGPVRFPRTGHK